MYGRLEEIAKVLASRAEQVVGVTGCAYRGWLNDEFHSSEHQGATGPLDPGYAFNEVPTRETHPLEDAENQRFARKIASAERLVLEMQIAGHRIGSVIRLPRIYGATAIAPLEWCIVRRVLDGRKILIVPGDGLILETKVHSRNAAAAILAAVDNPSAAAGEVFNAGDERPLTLRDWAGTIAEALNHKFQFISVPFEHAAPSYAYARDPWAIGHRVLDTSKIRQRLKWKPEVSVEEGLAVAAHAYEADPLPPGGEAERQIGDPFDYKAEDAYAAAATQFAISVDRVPFAGYRYAHPYRHPRPGSN
jgi:nucleoside-diphosphate-sugar epimerase